MEIDLASQDRQVAHGVTPRYRRNSEDYERSVLCCIGSLSADALRFLTARRLPDLAATVRKGFRIASKVEGIETTGLAVLPRGPVAPRPAHIRPAFALDRLL
jgi:hypothetical protein